MYQFTSNGSIVFPPTNGIIIKRDPSISTSSIINIGEIDLYESTSPLSKSQMQIDASSASSGHDAGKCSDNNITEYFESLITDTSPWLWLDSNFTFTKVVVTNAPSNRGRMDKFIIESKIDFSTFFHVKQYISIQLLTRNFMGQYISIQLLTRTFLFML